MRLSTLGPFIRFTPAAKQFPVVVLSRQFLPLHVATTSSFTRFQRTLGRAEITCQQTGNNFCMFPRPTNTLALFTQRCRSEAPQQTENDVITDQHQQFLCELSLLLLYLLLFACYGLLGHTTISFAQEQAFSDDFTEPEIEELERMKELPQKLEFPYYQSAYEAERWLRHYFEHPNTRIVLLACKIGLSQLGPGSEPEKVGYWTGVLLGLFDKHNEMAVRWFDALLATSCKSTEATIAVWTALFACKGEHTRKHIPTAIRQAEDRTVRRELLKARRNLSENPEFPFHDVDAELMEATMPIWRGYYAATGDVRILQRLVDMTKYWRMRAPAPAQIRAAVAREQLMYFGAEYEPALDYLQELMNPERTAAADGYVAPVEARQTLQAVLLISGRVRREEDAVMSVTPRS